jgi:hypothetical protein
MSLRPSLAKLDPDERWQDLMLPGHAEQVEAALWWAASVGVDGHDIATALEDLAARRQERP